jgi:hypothetical protein
VENIKQERPGALLEKSARLPPSRSTITPVAFEVVHLEDLSSRRSSCYSTRPVRPSPSRNLWVSPRSLRISLLTVRRLRTVTWSDRASCIVESVDPVYFARGASQTSWSVCAFASDINGSDPRTID